MKNLQAVFLDFDGVILESIDVKTWAFAKLFEDYPEYVQRIVDYHMANGGISRYVKIKHIHKEILQVPLSEEDFQSLCEKYSQLVFDRVLNSEFVVGAKEFLDKYYQTVPIFIISGTPHKEMNSIVEKKGLSKYFEGIYGSPRTKDDWVKELLDKHSFKSEQTIYVGDALSDYEAAIKNNCVFFGRVPEGEKDIFAGKKVHHRIKDLDDLGQILTKDSQCILSE